MNVCLLKSGCRQHRHAYRTHQYGSRVSESHHWMTSASVLLCEFRSSSHLESVCRDGIENTISGYKYFAYFSNDDILFCFFGHLELKISIFTLLYVFKLQIELCHSIFFLPFAIIARNRAFWDALTWNRWFNIPKFNNFAISCWLTLFSCLTILSTISW